MVVVGLGYDFLFKSLLGHCALPATKPSLRAQLLKAPYIATGKHNGVKFRLKDILTFSRDI